MSYLDDPGTKRSNTLIFLLLIALAIGAAVYIGVPQAFSEALNKPAVAEEE